MKDNKSIYRDPELAAMLKKVRVVGGVAHVR